VKVPTFAFLRRLGRLDPSGIPEAFHDFHNNKLIEIDGH